MTAGYRPRGFVRLAVGNRPDSATVAGPTLFVIPQEEAKYPATLASECGIMTTSPLSPVWKVSMRYDYEGKAFTAYDPDGRGYLLSPVYRFDDGSSPPKAKTFSARDCVGLLPEDGRWVRRERPGRYELMGTAKVREVPLTSRGEGAV